MLARGETLVSVGEGVDAVQPLLERELVGIPGCIAAGVTECHLDLDVPVLDRGGDQAAGFADDEPGQRPAQPARGQAGAGGIGRDGIQPALLTAVLVDPGDQAGDVAADM